jgi:hypothetical protein
MIIVRMKTPQSVASSLSRIRTKKAQRSELMSWRRPVGRILRSLVVAWIPAVLVLARAFGAAAATRVGDGEDDASGISVIVGLVPSSSTTTIHLEQFGSIERILYKAKAYAMTVPDEATLERLQNHPGVEYVSIDGFTDPMVGEISHEQVGWGLLYIQALSDLIPAAAPASQQSDGTCFRMCIVDGGLFASHPDIVSPLFLSLCQRLGQSTTAPESST